MAVQRLESNLVLVFSLEGCLAPQHFSHFGHKVLGILFMKIYSDFTTVSWHAGLIPGLSSCLCLEEVLLCVVMVWG
jgi:hypothetical protein